MESIASLLSQLLSTARYGRSLRALDATGSTNDDAREDAARGAANGHTVVADLQTRGRGSSGRSWSSPPGEDLFVSIVDRPPLALAQLPPLTLAVGLGVAEAVETLVDGAQTQLKWPNDVWLGGKKVAGILVETSAIGSTVDFVVIGIGLNVNRLEFDPDLQDIATSLRATQPGRGPVDRVRALAELLGSVEREVDRFVAEGPHAIVRALEPRLALLGRRARCGDVEGVVAGVSEDGALRMQTDRGVREVHAGRLTALPS